MRLSLPITLAAVILVLTACSAPPADVDSAPPADRDASLLACLADLGYDVSALPDGGIEVQIADGQSLEAYQADYLDCMEQVGIPTEYEPLTADQLHSVYDQTLETRSCLIEQGFELPEPPSEQYFADHYYEDPYVPFSFLPQDALTQEEIDRLMIECPQPAI